MTLVIPDRVKETTTTTGTGTINLAGAVVGFRTFVSGVGSGNTTYYGLTSGAAWEVGVGTVTSGTPDTLARTTIMASSNSGSAITLSGTSTAFATAPAGLLGNLGLYAPVMSKPIPTKTATGFTNVAGASSPTATNTPMGINFVTADAAGGFAYATPPATPYTLDALLIAGPENAIVPFFGWSDGTKYLVSYAPKILDTNYGKVVTASYSVIGTLNTVHNTSANLGCYGDRVWLRAKNDGTNASWWMSFDGYNWGTTAIYTTTLASSYLGSSGFTRMVFGTNTTGSVTLASFTIS